MFTLNILQSFFMLLSVITLYTAQLDSASAKNRSKIAISEQISVLKYVDKDLACQSVLHVSFCQLI